MRTSGVRRSAEIDRVELLGERKRGCLGDDGQVGLGGELRAGVLDRLAEAVEAILLHGGVAVDDGHGELADDGVARLLEVELVEVAGGVLRDAVHVPGVAQDRDLRLDALDFRLALLGLGVELAEVRGHRRLYALVGVDEVRRAGGGQAVVERHAREQEAARDDLVDESLDKLVVGVLGEFCESDHVIGPFSSSARRGWSWRFRPRRAFPWGFPRCSWCCLSMRTGTGTPP